MNERVIVTSMVNGIVGITMPNSRIKKIWPKKGTKLPVEKDLLREAIYEPGVEYMFKKGNQYTIHLMGKSVTVTVANSEN